MIRPLLPEDQDLLALVLADGQQLVDTMDSWTPQKALSEFKAAQALGVFEGNVLKSFLFFRQMDKVFEVTYIFTQSKYRSQGLAKSLLLELVKLAQKQSMRIWLEVHHKNLAAQGLYSGLGFRQVGSRPSYYPDGGSALLLEIP